jgi:hypothetical protein
VVLGLVAPLGWALAAILMAWFKPAAKSLSLARGLPIASAFTMSPVVAVTGSWWFFEGSLDVGQWLVIGAIVNNAAIVVLMFEIVKRAGPVFFSGSNTLPRRSCRPRHPVFGDSHSLWIWAALVLMFIGLFCVNLIGSSVG